MFEKQTSEGRGLQPPLAQGMLKGACSPVPRGAQREPAQAVWGCWGDGAEGTCTVLALLWDIAALSLHPAESRASCSARVTCVHLYKTLLMYAVEISAAGIHHLPGQHFTYGCMPRDFPCGAVVLPPHPLSVDSGVDIYGPTHWANHRISRAGRDPAGPWSPAPGRCRESRKQSFPAQGAAL